MVKPLLDPPRWEGASTHIHSLTTMANNQTKHTQQAVAFDPSGQYLGVAAGTNATVFLAKEWSQVAEYTDARCVCPGVGGVDEGRPSVCVIHAIQPLCWHNMNNEQRQGDGPALRGAGVVVPRHSLHGPDRAHLQVKGGGLVAVSFCYYVEGG